MAKYSLGEIDALAKKATRGAGYSWGIAEETGKAVRWLCAYGFSGAEALANHLTITANQNQNFVPRLVSKNSESIVFANKNSESNICALSCCALVNDLGHQLQSGKTISFDNVLFPLLALPAAGRIAEAYKINVSFSYADKHIICGLDGISIKDSSVEPVEDTPPLLSGFALEKIADVIFTGSDKNIQNTHFPSPKSREIKKEVLDVLEKFAHETYAPATEESRLRGAG